MPSKSEKQHKLMAYALSCKQGKTKKCPKNIKDIADSMSEEQLKDYVGNKSFESKILLFDDFNKKDENKLSIIFLNENNKKELYLQQRQQLFLGDILVSESGFEIMNPDKWFDEKYVTLYDLKTLEKFQGRGFAKYLLDQIFKYVKNKLYINIIALIVDKNNYKAVNLYLNRGFEINIEYDTSYSLVKKL